MATKPKTGSRNGIEWRTDEKGIIRYPGVLNTKAGKDREYATKDKALEAARLSE